MLVRDDMLAPELICTHRETCVRDLSHTSLQLYIILAMPAVVSA